MDETAEEKKPEGLLSLQLWQLGLNPTGGSNLN